MQTLTIERQRHDIIRRVMNIDNAELLKRFDNYIKREEKKAIVKQEEEYHDLTKEELIAGLEQAFKEAKLAREGKLEGKPIDEFLDEILN
ncbi:MAG: hypothetical protein J6M30_04665 [Bacteroidales bacterium]|nr:hypothetical protein [Bacteroidales bacterium]